MLNNSSKNQLKQNTFRKTSTLHPKKNYCFTDYNLQQPIFSLKKYTFLIFSKIFG